jgi:hypothetical protein
MVLSVLKVVGQFRVEVMFSWYVSFFFLFAVQTRYRSVPKTGVCRQPERDCLQRNRKQSVCGIFLICAMLRVPSLLLLWLQILAKARQNFGYSCDLLLRLRFVHRARCVHDGALHRKSI